ncbi:MAG: hypothetical protein ACTSUE_03395 [Promethearchaeota archaeon]
MSKLRKGVAKQKGKTGKPATRKKPKLTASRLEAIEKDKYLFKSALKSYLIAGVLLALLIWMSGGFPPFDKLHEINAIVDELVNGLVAVLFFLFIILSWGNAMEVKGNVLEWKQIIITLAITMIVCAWGGLVTFTVGILGCFSVLTGLWYLNK